MNCCEYLKGLYQADLNAYLSYLQWLHVIVTLQGPGEMLPPPKYSDILFSVLGALDAISIMTSVQVPFPYSNNLDLQVSVEDKGLIKTFVLPSTCILEFFKDSNSYSRLTVLQASITMSFTYSI